MNGRIAVPDSFRAQPRWWTEGTGWLDSLPAMVERQCAAWDLKVDGRPRHGSNALIIPVTRAGESLVLRMSPPDDRTTGEIGALRFWAGRGTVLLIDHDADAGAALLERLDADRSLAGVGLAEAAVVLGGLMGRLAVPVDDPAVPSTASMISGRIDRLRSDWEAVGRPFPANVVDAAVAAGRELATIDDPVAVDGDLHHDQVLAGVREPWLVVDPLLHRGDIAYDLARCLWWRLDEMADTDIVEQMLLIGRAAGIDDDHARTSVTYRAVDYWLWGLRNGLTEDPVRCERLYGAVR